MEKMLDAEFSKRKFYELNEQKLRIQDLMSCFQNPVPLREEDIIQFEELKNDVTSKLNSIAMDFKIEWERTNKR